MRRRDVICFTFLLLLAGLLASFTVSAETAAYTNPDTNYQVFLRDDADLLSDAQERELALQMQEITAYGGAAFVSAGNHSGGSADSYAESCYRTYFGKTSGTLFLIDMMNRKIYIFSDGDIYRVISNGRAELITDNSYKMATAGDYAGCAKEVYREILILLQGGKITQTMRYVSNIMLALILALLICYLIVRILSNTFKPSRGELLGAAVSVYAFQNFQSQHRSTQRTYNPHTSGSSGGGGGGGGGGSSGGGGGHSF